jgi:hypothetical protein
VARLGPLISLHPSGCSEATRKGLAAAVAGIGVVGSAAVITVIGSSMRRRQ